MTEENRDYYRFFSRNLLRGLLAFALFFIGFLIFKNYVDEHYETWIAPIKDQPTLIYTVFFLNELIIGFIPPEFYMFLHVEDPPSVFWGYVTLMTILSYIGGLLSYLFGVVARRSRFMRRWLVGPRIRPLIRNYHKYGGILIFIGAITPVPFALTSMISGALEYPFRNYIKYAAFRFLRFYPYAALVYSLGTVNLMEVFKTLF